MSHLNLLLTKSSPINPDKERVYNAGAVKSSDSFIIAFCLYGAVKTFRLD